MLFGERSQGRQCSKDVGYDLTRSTIPEARQIAVTESRTTNPNDTFETLLFSFVAKQRVSQGLIHA